MSAEKHATLPAQLAAERRWTHDDGAREFARTAAEPALGMRLNVSVTRWRRWLSGQGGSPRPANARVLEDPPDQVRLGELCLARLDLAAARLGMNDLQGACEQLTEVLAISSRRRTSAVNRRLRQLSVMLGQPRFAGTLLATETGERISHYTAVSLVPSLPPGPHS